MAKMVKEWAESGSLSHITVFLSNEDGEKLSLMGDRWSAQLILSF